MGVAEGQILRKEYPMTSLQANYTDQLIPIHEHEGKQAVSGRELHKFLEVRRDYTTWLQKMTEYGFVEDQDFTPVWGESTGGRPSVDHALTLDMAKELSMIQRTEKGKQARQYFIECERRALAAQNPLARPELVTRADLARMVLESEEQLEKQRPIVDYHQRFVAESDDIITIDNFASQVGSTGPQVRALLEEKGVAIRRVIGQRFSKSKQQLEDVYEWRARQGKPSSEWFVLRPQHNAPRHHNNQVRQTLYVKQFHVVDLAKKLNLAYQQEMELEAAA